MNGRLCFGSTPHELNARFGLGLKLDETALAAWLVLQPRLSDHTFFQGIRWVPPGSVVVYERGQLTMHRYWQPERLAPLQLRDHREYADALLATLQQAVQDRLQPHTAVVAAQLSGGLDSSSVVTLAAEALLPQGRDLLAITAVPTLSATAPFADRFPDEGEHAAATAALHANVRHARVDAGEASLFAVLDRHTDAQGAPVINPHHHLWIDSTYAAAHAAGATTLLTGSMGNTTVSANGNLALVDALQRGNVRHALSLFATDRAAGMRTWGSLPSQLLSAFAPGVLDAADRMRRRRVAVEEFTGVRPEFARANGFDLGRLNRRFPEPAVADQALAAIERFDFGAFHEVPRRLYRLDAADPTFDRRVVELTLRIPLHQYCADGVPRALIRTAMQGRLPDVVRLERRRGLQSADFMSMLARERSSIADELAHMARTDPVSRAVDVPLLHERLNWTERQVADYGWHQYSNRLMRALSVGRFVRRLHEGDLFRTLPAASDGAAEFLIRM